MVSHKYKIDGAYRCPRPPTSSPGPSPPLPRWHSAPRSSWWRSARSLRLSRPPSRRLREANAGAGPPCPAPAPSSLTSHPFLVSFRSIDMGIFSRTRDIIAANFTDLLDKAEDPAKMIRMIILEMEETLVEVRASAARTIADQKEMRRHIAKLGTLQESWTEKAELALSKGREDLAKAALVARQKAADMAAQLTGELTVLDAALKGAEEDIAKLQNKLREARTRQNSIVTRLESAHNRVKLREMYAGPKIADAFSRFEIMERRVDLAEGRADALGLGQPTKSLEEEIAELRSSEKIDAELAALKARVGGKTA